MAALHSLIRLLLPLGLLLGFGAVLAGTSTPTYTDWSATRVIGCAINANRTYTGGSPSAVCSQFLSAAQGAGCVNTTYNSVTMGAVTNTTFTCTINATPSGSSFPVSGGRTAVCPQGATYDSASNLCVDQCSTGTVLVNGQCQTMCSSDQIRDPTTGQCTSCTGGRIVIGGTCQCPTGRLWNPTTSTCEIDTVQKACELLKDTTVFISQGGRLAPGQTVCTELGCYGTMRNTLFYVTDKTTGKTSTEGEAVLTGTKCEFHPETDAKKDSCPGGFQGELNGVSTCVPYDPELNKVESSTTKSNTTTTTTGDDSTGTETEDRETSCEGDRCTTKTTTCRPDGNDADSDPDCTTEETEEDKDEYCKEHEEDPVCTKGSFAGNCQAGYECEGDAVICAIAKRLHEAVCLFDKEDEGEKDLYDQAKADPTRTGLETATVALTPSNFDQTELFGGGRCIADLSVTVWGSSVSLPFSVVCDSLAMLGNLLVGVSLLIAIRIVGRG